MLVAIIQDDNFKLHSLVTSGHIHTHLHIKQIKISREQTIKRRN